METETGVKATSVNISHPTTSTASILTAAKGSGITLIGSGFSYAGRLVLGILLARLMGVEQYGLFDLAGSVFYIVVGLAPLGLDAAIVRYVAMFAARRDKESINGALIVGLGIPLFISLIAGAFLFGLAGPVAQIAFHDARLLPLLRIVALAIPFGVLITTTVAATQGFKQMQYKVIAQDVSQTLIKLILIVIIAGLGLNAVRAFTIHTVGIVTTCCLMLYFLHKLSPLNLSLGTVRRDTRQMLVFSLPLYLSQILSMFNLHLQTILLGVLSTMAAVGIFAAVIKIGAVSKMFHASIVVTAAPIVSELYGQGQQEQLGHFYTTMTKWTFTFNLPLFLIVLMYSKEILSIFGGIFVTGYLALVVLAIGNLIDAGTGICGVIINMTGNTKWNLLNSILAVSVTLILNMLLIPSLGVVGAAIAMAAAVGAVNLARLLEVFVLFRLLPYNKDFIKPIMAGLVGLAVSSAANHWIFSRTELVHVLLNVTLLLVAYAGAIWLLGLSEEDQAILKRLYNRLFVLPLRG